MDHRQATVSGQVDVDLDPLGAGLDGQLDSSQGVLRVLVAGAAVSVSPATLPTALAGACQLVGKLGLPLALLALGGTLAVTPVRGHVWAALGASAIRISGRRLATIKVDSPLRWR